MTDPSILGEHFTVVLGETKTDEDTDAGVILHQDPAADSKVQDEVTPITVTVSGGPETVNMLDLKNMEYSKAYLAVTEMGLKVATPTYEHDDTIAYNHVISFTPLENNPVPLGTEVHMVVSLGPATGDLFQAQPGRLNPGKGGRRYYRPWAEGGDCHPCVQRYRSGGAGSVAVS